jgi:hypothetical protein
MAFIIFWSIIGFLIAFYFITTDWMFFKSFSVAEMFFHFGILITMWPLFLIGYFIGKTTELRDKNE